MEALGRSKAELSGLVSSGSLEQQTVPIRTEVRTPVCLTGVLGIVPLEGQGEDKRQVTYLGCHSGEWRLDPGSLDLAPPSLGAGIHTHLDPQSHGLPGPSCCPHCTFLQCPYWKAGSWLRIPLGQREGKLSALGRPAERRGMCTAQHQAPG